MIGYQSASAPQPRPLHNHRVLVAVLCGGLFLGLFTATQYVAYRFGFHSNLGPPWFVVPAGAFNYLQAGAVCLIGGGLSLLLFPEKRRWTSLMVLGAVLLGGISLCPVLYAPVRYLTWGIVYKGFSSTSPYQHLFSEGLIAGGIVWIGSTLSFLLARRHRRKLVPTGSHGTATWSDGRKLQGEQGLIIGRQENGKLADSLLRYDGEGHLITIAPTRSGKGVGGVIPNLMSYPHSMLVTDPKGENYAVTARYRREVLGQRVIALDPFDVLGSLHLPSSGASLNPMDLVDPWRSDMLESAALLADMLVLPPTGRGEVHFWAEEAKGLLTGLILYVAADQDVPRLGETNEKRTLGVVRELLTLPRKELEDLMKSMITNTELAHGLVSRAAARHLQKADKERSGVVSMAQSHTHFLDSPAVSAATEYSTFWPSDFRAGDLTLYLILPAHYLDTYSRWLRLVVASVLHELVRTPQASGERIVFLLDEFANLGRMTPLLKAVSLLAGYGVSLWMYLQDLSQLKGTYPDKWGTFLANSDVLQAFGTNDYDTARYLSNLTGDTTIWVETENQSRGLSRGKYLSHQRGQSQNFSEKARKLLLPDEVRRLPPGEQLLFVRGQQPIRAQQLNYLTDREFHEEGRPIFDVNPLHA